MLLTQHNLHYYQQLMQGIRAAIAAGNLAEHAQKLRADWALEDIPAL
jgi:queuine tRNA-ribosyltransferase